MKNALKKAGKQIEAAVKKAGDQIEVAVAKNDTKPQREESNKLEVKIKGMLDAMSNKVNEHVQAWNTFLTANPNTSDKAQIQQNCAILNADLAALAKIFTCADPTEKGLKEIAWDIHEAGTVNAETAEANCALWIVAVRNAAAKFEAQHLALMIKLVPSIDDLSKRPAAAAQQEAERALEEQMRSALQVLQQQQALSPIAPQQQPATNFDPFDSPLLFSLKAATPAKPLIQEQATPGNATVFESDDEFEHVEVDETVPAAYDPFTTPVKIGGSSSPKAKNAVT